MKSQTIIFLIGLLLVVISGCNKSEFLGSGDYFHLSNDGAKMPIWVNGNFDSDVMLVTVHGGPGDTGMGFHISPGFKSLEEDYMVVYWDQRFSGMAQGHPDISTMHPDQFIEDTEKVVQLLQDKYPGKSLFMLGLSWGGQLSAGYLGRDNHDSNFKGWIDLDGSIYAELEAQLMKDWVLERVPNRLNDPEEDKEFWQFVIDWYEANPNPGNYTAAEPYWFVSALEGDAYDYETFNEEYPTPYGELIFRSMFSMSYYVYAFADEENIIEWDQLDYTSELSNITIPSLMLWGLNDGIVPHQVADYVYDHLGTDVADKKVVKLDECGHGPHNDQPEKFYDEVRNFIEKYK